MLVVIPFCTKDYPAAERLVEWIGQLGKDNWHHSALFVAAQPVEMADQYNILHIGKGIFGGAFAIRQNQAEERGWPISSNAMFRTAVDYIEREACTPFLWLEPDCVPLVPDWLSKIQEEYQKAGKPFMGAVFDSPFPHLSACAVYPPNVRELNPKALQASAQPWDLVAPEKTLAHTHSTKLIQHLWGEAKRPPVFNGEESLSVISKDAVLFHRCKDGSLISAWQRRLRMPASKRAERHVIVRRTLARGDAIAATFVATRLQELGFTVTFQTHRKCAPWIKMIRPQLTVTDVDRACAINLDEAYEHHPRQRELGFAEMFHERACMWAAKAHVDLGKVRNYAPRMEVSDKDRKAWLQRFKAYPRPWTMICPRSQSHIRVVADEVWRQACADIPGTKFWLAVHGPAPSGIVDLKDVSLDAAPSAIAVCDLMLTVDTGPMHVAAAMGVPMVVIEQSFNPELRISDQRDWLKVQPPLDCLNCQGPLCRKNNPDPPCQHPPASIIIEAVRRKLEAKLDDVSVAMACYRPTAERLNRALSAVIPQVSEVVVAFDQAGLMPPGALQHPKVRYVHSRERDIGYGRKANFAARHTNSPWILFLNDDCFVEPDCVQKMMQCTGGNVAVVGALLLYPNGTIQHGGTNRNPGSRDWAHSDHGQRQSRHSAPTEMEFVTGACSLVNRKAFYSVSGFDEEFYLYCDDSDLCMKLRQNGYKVMFTPHARGIHECGSSAGTTPNLNAIMQQSRSRLNQKWGWYFERNSGVQLGTFR